MKRYFKKKHLADIKAKSETIGGRTDTLVLKFAGHQFENAKAREYAHHGFGRRLGILRRCIENVFRIVRPGTIKIPSKTKLYDAQINVQSFITNAYGSVDNLAWVWAFERGMADDLPRRQIGLRKHCTEIRSSFSPEFKSYLETMDAWFEYLVEYRDALAHRIPLYIPPGGVRSKDIAAYNALMDGMNKAIRQFDRATYERLSLEQSNLLIFQPLITHSITETTHHFVFHAQLIADFLTVEKLGEKMLAELSGRR
jgi:hypothetical protein